MRGRRGTMPRRPFFTEFNYCDRRVDADDHFLIDAKYGHAQTALAMSVALPQAGTESPRAGVNDVFASGAASNGADSDRDFRLEERFDGV